MSQELYGILTDFWPQVEGIDGRMVDAKTITDPITGIPFCRDCWNGRHKRDGCKNVGCLCGCYNGKNVGLSKPHAPHKDCKENEKLPDVGTFTV